MDSSRSSYSFDLRIHDSNNENEEDYDFIGKDKLFNRRGAAPERITPINYVTPGTVVTREAGFMR